MNTTFQMRPPTSSVGFNSVELHFLTLLVDCSRGVVEFQDSRQDMAVTWHKLAFVLYFNYFCSNLP